MKRFWWLICFVLPTYFFASLASAEGLSDGDRQRYIDSDKDKISRAITKFQRNSHKNCKKKLKISLNDSVLASLPLADQQNRYERLKKNVTHFIDQFFEACGDSSFKQEVKTKKNINLTLDLNRPGWKIKSRGRDINVIVPSVAGKPDLIGMLKKKVR